MGSHVGKHEAQNEVSEKVESEEPGPSQTSEPESADDNEVFGHVEADVNQNNGPSSEKTAVTDSKGAADTENAWNEANTADHGEVAHTWSASFPGMHQAARTTPSKIAHRSQMSFRPSKRTVEQLPIARILLKTIQKSSLRATEHHKWHLQAPRTKRNTEANPGGQRDTGLLDQLGKFFGGEQEGSRKGSKKGVSAMKSSQLAASPQKTPQQSGAHARPGDDNRVVSFFKTIVSPRTPPPPTKGTDGQKQPAQARSQETTRAAHKGHKDARGDGQGTLSKIFKLGGKDSRSGSPSKR